MSSESVIRDIEGDIVDRLLSEVSMLSPARGGTCRAVGDIRTALTLDVPPPGVLVQYAGEVAEVPAVIGPTRYRQMSRLSWDLKVIASSFTLDGEGRADHNTQAGEANGVGAYTLLDAVFNTLEGYALPHSPHPSRMFFNGSSPYGLGESQVIYTSSWYCDVLRFKQ